MRTIHDDSPAFLFLKSNPAHLRFALRTARRSVGFGLGGCCFKIGDGRFGRRGCDISGRKQLAAFGDVAFAMMVRIATKATRLRVAFRKDVQTPATHEFCTAQFDRCDLVTAARRLADARQKCHEGVFMRHDPAVGNRATCKIAIRGSMYAASSRRPLRRAVHRRSLL